MENLSDKAKIVYATLKMLGAEGSENRVTSYAILDFISENEEVGRDLEAEKNSDQVLRTRVAKRC